MGTIEKFSFYLFLFFSVVCSAVDLTAQKKDTIYHVNGNILTGDFKNLNYGVISWKMDGMGTISLEEVKVNTIISKKQFQIKMKDDSIYFGSFGASDEPRMTYILMEDRKMLVRVEDIIEVYPIKKNFWMRTSGTFSFGLNYSKGSNVATVAFSGNLKYRKRISYFQLSWDDNNTFQGDSLSSTNSNISLAWQRVLKKSWSAQAVFGASQSSELGTQLRWALDLMVVKDLQYNSWNRLYLGGGLSAIHEVPYGDVMDESDLAAILQLVWKVYKYTSPKVWVDANLSFLPYLTAGRYRTSFNLNPKVNLLSDNFMVGFSFYYNFDSNPSENAISSQDYGLNMQLSYTFH